MVSRANFSQIDSLRHEIVQLNLSIKALIQDIKQCKGTWDDLNELNSDGRKIISTLNNNLQLMNTLALEEEKEPARSKLLQEVKNFKEELAATFSSFQKANISAMLSIEKSNREQLMGGDESSRLRNRKKKDQENLVKTSGNITDQLLSISRTLSDTVQRNTETLDTLVSSSSNVDSTLGELDNTGSMIAQSGKLLAKYGRREKTDKFLVLFAFVFFLVCVFYVIQKRLF